MIGKEDTRFAHKEWKFQSRLIGHVSEEMYDSIGDIDLSCNGVSA